MARTFVVTGEPRYEEFFHRIIAIRDGAAPRPMDYGSIYWDFVSASGKDPRPGREAVALEALMLESGFTEDEFELLRRAKGNSDALIALEEQAMAAAKGLFPDDSGAYVIEGEPDLELATGLLFGPEYHRAKAGIMRPVEEFFASVATRTAAVTSPIPGMDSIWRCGPSGRARYAAMSSFCSFFLLFSAWLIWSTNSAIMASAISPRSVPTECRAAAWTVCAIDSVR